MDGAATFLQYMAAACCPEHSNTTNSSSNSSSNTASNTSSSCSSSAPLPTNRTSHTTCDTSTTPSPHSANTSYASKSNTSSSNAMHATSSSHRAAPTFTPALPSYAPTSMLGDLDAGSRELWLQVCRDTFAAPMNKLKAERVRALGLSNQAVQGNGVPQGIGIQQQHQQEQHLSIGRSGSSGSSDDSFGELLQPRGQQKRGRRRQASQDSNRRSKGRSAEERDNNSLPSPTSTKHLSIPTATPSTDPTSLHPSLSSADPPTTDDMTPFRHEDLGPAAFRMVLATAAYNRCCRSGLRHKDAFVVTQASGLCTLHYALQVLTLCPP